MRALHNNAAGHTDKSGGAFDPIEFPEDDIFGYMRAKKGSGKIEEEEEEERRKRRKRKNLSRKKEELE